MSETRVIPTGTANLASVLAGLERAGISASLARTPGDLAAAHRVVLPGVGSFGAAMNHIDSLGLRDALIGYVKERRPLLAICLGLQLLATSSEESPDIEGLGLIDARIRRLPGSVRVPQLGWNTIEPVGAPRLLDPGWAYFANSYRLEGVPEGWAGATTEYGGEFAAALERGAQLACQFHPELSGSWGVNMLRRWADQTVRIS